VLSPPKTMAPPDKDGNPPAAALSVLDLLAALKRRAWTEAVDAAATMVASSSSSSYPGAATMASSSSGSGCHPASVVSLFAPRFARAALRRELPVPG